MDVGQSGKGVSRTGGFGFIKAPRPRFPCTPSLIFLTREIGVYEIAKLKMKKSQKKKEVSMSKSNDGQVQLPVDRSLSPPL